MGFDPIVLGAVGALVSAGGTVMNGVAQANAANYQAQVASNNATIAQQNAIHAEQAGAQATEAQSRKGAAQQAAIKGALAANGLDVNSGSAVDVEESAAKESKLDTLNADHNTQLQVYGYRTQSTGYEAQAKLDKMTADQAPIGAAIGAAGGLLGNASSIGFNAAKTGGSISNSFSTLFTGGSMFGPTVGGVG